ncbi:hypothetical protein BJ138DRAFT_1129056 [Hygrophoropsis aurantiaca]|uniref:Uncharacterized protein n=1 Tax=Hygrophoropsis aurantiaca TaxID=72124 RepID=A0ACB8A3L8_9AGAM|nr:hypothetical protein BJ138DRAFT_1129056 [Hygrophoropsis aurantiaca]
MRSLIIQNYLGQLESIIREHPACINKDGRVAIPAIHTPDVALNFSKLNEDLATRVDSESLSKFLDDPSHNLDELDGELIEPERILRVALLALRKDSKTKRTAASTVEDVIQRGSASSPDNVLHQEISDLRKMHEEATQKEEQLESKIHSLTLDLANLRAELSRETSRWEKNHDFLVEDVREGLDESRRDRRQIHKAQEVLTRSQESARHAIVHVEEVVHDVSTAFDDFKASLNQRITRKSDIVHSFHRFLGYFVAYQYNRNIFMHSRMEKLQQELQRVTRLQREQDDSIAPALTDVQYLRQRLDRLESPSGPLSSTAASLESLKTSVDKILEDITDLNTSLGEATGIPVSNQTLAEEFRWYDSTYEERGVTASSMTIPSPPASEASNDDLEASISPSLFSFRPVLTWPTLGEYQTSSVDTASTTYHGSTGGSQGTGDSENAGDSEGDSESDSGEAGLPVMLEPKLRRLLELKSRSPPEILESDSLRDWKEAMVRYGAYFGNLPLDGNHTEVVIANQVANGISSDGAMKEGCNSRDVSGESSVGTGIACLSSDGNRTEAISANEVPKGISGDGEAKGDLDVQVVSGESSVGTGIASLSTDEIHTEVREAHGTNGAPIKLAFQAVGASQVSKEISGDGEVKDDHFFQVSSAGSSLSRDSQLDESCERREQSPLLLNTPEATSLRSEQYTSSCGATQEHHARGDDDRTDVIPGAFIDQLRRLSEPLYPVRQWVQRTWTTAIPDLHAVIKFDRTYLVDPSAHLSVPGRYILPSSRHLALFFAIAMLATENAARALETLANFSQMPFEHRTHPVASTSALQLPYGELANRPVDSSLVPLPETLDDDLSDASSIAAAQGYFPTMKVAGSRRKGKERCVSDVQKRKGKKGKENIRPGSKRARDDESDDDDDDNGEPKPKRGRPFGPGNYSPSDVKALLGFIENELPLGQRGWKAVHTRFVQWARKHKRPQRALKSLETKYKQLVRTTKPTGDGVCPPEVDKAHFIDNLINERAGTRDLHDSDFADNTGVISVSSDDDDTRTNLDEGVPTHRTVVTRSTHTNAPGPFRNHRGAAGMELINKLSVAFDPEVQRARDEGRAARSLFTTQHLTLSQQLHDTQSANDALRREAFELRSQLQRSDRERNQAEWKFGMLEMRTSRHPHMIQRGQHRGVPKKKHLLHEWHPDGGGQTMWITDDSSDGDEVNNAPYAFADSGLQHDSEARRYRHTSPFPQHHYSPSPAPIASGSQRKCPTRVVRVYRDIEKNKAKAEDGDEDENGASGSQLPAGRYVHTPEV